MTEANKIINEQKFRMEPYPESVKKVLYDRALLMGMQFAGQFVSENHAIEHFYEQLTETFKEGWALGYAEGTEVASPEDVDDDRQDFLSETWPDNTEKG